MSDDWEDSLRGRIYQSVRTPFLSAVSHLGLQIARRSPANDDMLALRAMLDRQNVDLILDVGANVGQFAEKIFEAGYRGRLISYEPLSRPYGVILEKSRTNPRWDVVQMCIGDEPGELELKISHNEIASSALDVTPGLSEFQPEFEYVGSETVEVQTLDQVASHALESADDPFVKIDVQGFEEQVLAGASRTLERCVGLQIELSFVELYAGQMLFTDMLRGLEDRGFTAHRMFPAWLDVRDGRWLQADVVLFRNR